MVKLYKEFNDNPGKCTSCTKSLNKWIKKNGKRYFYKVVGFTGDLDNGGRTILIAYSSK